MKRIDNWLQKQLENARNYLIRILSGEQKTKGESSGDWGQIRYSQEGKVKIVVGDKALGFYFTGSRRFSNVFWAMTASLGGLGFLLAGLSTFFGRNLLFFSDSSNIPFVPQGLVLVFYGVVGLILGVFLCLTVRWDVGLGCNEFIKETQIVRISRKGFPNRDISLRIGFDKIRALRLIIRAGINPRKQLFLCLKDEREIPLNGIDQLMSFSEMETIALTIAKFVDVIVEVR
jgi:hypothetical protein